MRHEIIIDMDGVLVDFVKGAYHVAERVGGNISPWSPEFNPRTTDIPEMYGVPKENWFLFYRELESQPPEFWENLPIYPWAYRIVETFSCLYEKVSFASHCVSHNAAMGKVMWLKKHGFPMANRGLYLSTSQSKFIYTMLPSRPVLIDDFDSVVMEYRENGGRAFLFPQPWNTAWRPEYENVSADLIHGLRLKDLISQIIS